MIQILACKECARDVRGWFGPPITMESFKPRRKGSAPIGQDRFFSCPHEPVEGSVPGKPHELSGPVRSVLLYAHEPAHSPRPTRTDVLE